MKQYKVINAFESLQKGDVFVEDGDMFVTSKETTGDHYACKYVVAVDADTIAELLNEGLIEEVCDDCNNDCKLQQLKDYIQTMIDTYNQDYANLMQEYEAGNVQPCVKVEAETVHYNLVKVLNHLKDYVDGEVGSSN